MKRLLDLFLVAAFGIALILPCLIIALLVRLTSEGPALYWSQRVGRFNKIFLMPKFRTMKIGTPAVATHLLSEAQNHLTPIGGILRRTSLDELPQLISVARGDMSFVGPRPALFNQNDLIELRTQAGVDKLRPGITGLAQINGRDDLSIEEKVAYDRRYLETQSLGSDIAIMLGTVVKVVRVDGIKH